MTAHAIMIAVRGLLATAFASFLHWADRVVALVDGLSSKVSGYRRGQVNK